VSRDIRLKRNGTEYLPFEANICFGLSLKKLANIHLFAILRIRNIQANMMQICNEVKQILVANTRKEEKETSPSPKCWLDLFFLSKKKRR